MTNKLIAFILSLAFTASSASVISSTTANADWEYENDNWYYYTENGSKLTNDTVYDSNYGGVYYLDADGAMVTNKLMKHFQNDNFYCYYGCDGKMVTDTIQFVPEVNSYMAFDFDGFSVKNAWINDDLNYYFIGDDFLPVTDTWVYDTLYDGLYYLNSDGTMAANTWVYNEGSDHWFYVGETGNIVDDGSGIIPTGYIVNDVQLTDDDDEWFNWDEYENNVDDDFEWDSEIGLYRSTMLKDASCTLNDGTVYYFDNEGLSLKNRWIYTDLLSKDFSKGYYFFGDDCAKATDTYIHDDVTGHDFYVDSNGRLVDDGSGITPGNTYYHLLFV